MRPNSGDGSDADHEITFDGHAPDALAAVGGDAVEKTLVESGLWTSLRTRPFSKVPAPGSRPRSIFVTAIDSNPLAPDPAVIIARRRDDFVNGLTMLAQLTAGPVRICTAPGADIPCPGDATRFQVAEFGGKHPAGLVGTHVHFLEPVGIDSCIWYIGYQDVIAIGALFTTGRIDVERVIALCGPAANDPRLLRTRIGASTNELLAGDEVAGNHVRAISVRFCPAARRWNGARISAGTTTSLRCCRKAASGPSWAGSCRVGIAFRDQRICVEPVQTGAFSFQYLPER